MTNEKLLESFLGADFYQIKDHLPFILNALGEKDEEMNGLIEIHHEQCKELELEIQSLTEQLQKAEEKLKQYNQNEV